MKFVQRTAGAAALGAAMLIGSGLSAPPAQAGYVVTLEQVGSNVVASGSGAIDLSGLSSIPPGIEIAFILPSTGVIVTGPESVVSASGYIGFTGPLSFGSGGATDASSGSGNIVGIAGLNNILVVPDGYVSGHALSDTSTYDNATFTSLGVTPGTYEWTWGSGQDQNFTLQIGPAAVPEPSALALLGTALAGLFLVRFRANRRASVCLRGRTEGITVASLKRASLPVGRPPVFRGEPV